MSKQLERFASCEQITEWVTPADERFANAIGGIDPKGLNIMRMLWKHWQVDWRMENIPKHPMLVSPIKRLLVPAALHEMVDVGIGWNGPNEGCMEFEFARPDDWRQCMPSDETTLVPNHDSISFNAAIALCGKLAGLAVLTRECDDEDGPYRDFMVCPISDDILAKLIASGSER